METDNQDAVVRLNFEGDRVRIVQKDGEPWFVAVDVCGVLGMADVTSALRMLDANEKGPLIVRTLGGDQTVNSISEPGLYKLLGRSRKPEARRFDRWVRHEVLPSIRRTGFYAATQTTPSPTSETPAELAIRALTAMQRLVAEQQAVIDALTPKARDLDALYGYIDVQRSGAPLPSPAPSATREFQPVEFLQGARRRWFSRSTKHRIVQETYSGHLPASEVARRYGLSPHLVYKWRAAQAQASSRG